MSQNETVVDLAKIYWKDVKDSTEKFKKEFLAISGKFRQEFKNKVGRNPTIDETHLFLNEVKNPPSDKATDTGFGDVTEEDVLKMQKIIRGHNVRKNNKFVVCYSCGGVFDVSKIQDHQKDNKCVKTMDQLRSELPRVLRGTAAVEPTASVPQVGASDEDYASYNGVARDSFRASLPTCPCGKKLELEVMVIHSTKCDKWKSGGGGGGAAGIAQVDEEALKKMQSRIRGYNVRKKEKLVFCYSCGEMFDASKIRQHQSDDKCTKTMDKLRGELPRILRGTAPVAPAQSLPAEDAADEDFTAYNGVARDSFRASLPTCPCGKKLELEVMVKHSTKCTKWKGG